MNFRHFLLIISTLLLSGCFEPDFTPLTSVAEECRCDTSLADRFETPLRIEVGRYKGRCIDSCRFRHADRLPPQIAKRYGAGHGYVVFANYRHDKQYWVARVPVDAVENVDVLFEDFYHGVTHVVLRFHFGDRGVRLFPQNQRQPSAQQHEIQDLVLSIEGVPAKDEKYDLFNSSLGNYLLDYRVVSGKEFADWTANLHHPVTKYRLNMTKYEARALLLRGLKASESESFKTRYQLASNNCATSILDLLGDERTDGLNWWLRLPRGWPVMPINGTLHALRERGLIGPGETSRINDAGVEPETL